MKKEEIMSIIDIQKQAFKKVYEACETYRPERDGDYGEWKYGLYGEDWDEERSEL